MKFRDTMQIAQRQLRVLTATLRDIAHRTDCDYEMTPEAERPRPCPCPRCEARVALETEARWRFEGRGVERTETMPRERKIVEAWREYCSPGAAVSSADFRLAEILGEGSRDEGFVMPTVRDWYVATSVIQWLATNVGQSILEAAGYVYGQYREDRVEREETGRQAALEAMKRDLEHRIAREADDRLRSDLKNVLDVARAICERYQVRL